MIVDAHVHLDDVRFEVDRDAVVQRARDAGVCAFIVPGVHPGRFRAVIDATKRYEGVYCALGLHPMVLPTLSRSVREEALGRLAWDLRGANAIAVGETGLDVHVAKRGYSLNEQAHAFEAQLEVARMLDLPVVLHILGAHGEALRRLEEGGPIRGMVHSYSGSADLVSRYVALGLHVSFGASITRPSARRPIEALIATPSDRLLIETDAPDQMPTGEEGDRNEPALIRRVLEVAARERGVTEDELALATTKNAEALFGIRVG